MKKNESQLSDTIILTRRNNIRLFLNAFYFSELAKNENLNNIERDALIKMSILTIVFALESIANSLLDELPVSSKISEQLEKFSILDKYEIFLQFINPHSKFERGCKETEHLTELIAFRNNQVHLKVKKHILKITPENNRIFSNERIELTNKLRIPLSGENLEHKHSLLALQTFDTFLTKYFTDWCQWTAMQTTRSIADSFIDKNLKFTIFENDFYDVAENKIESIGIKLTFLKWLTKEERKQDQIPIEYN